MLEKCLLDNFKKLIEQDKYLKIFSFENSDLIEIVLDAFDLEAFIFDKNIWENITNDRFYLVFKTFFDWWYPLIKRREHYRNNYGEDRLDGIIKFYCYGKHPIDINCYLYHYTPDNDYINSTHVFLSKYTDYEYVAKDTYGLLPLIEEHISKKIFLEYDELLATKK